MTHKILFVDDEPNILKALQRFMRKSGYLSEFVESGTEALYRIERKQYSVIVSDMRMPGMNGLELIKSANEKDPLSVKIILSGYSDIDDIMNAVNGGHIHSYITKPWKEANLMITLMNACEMFERRQTEKEMLQELKEKNRELKELNENLERIVAARTREIQAGNRLLNTILKGAGEDEVLNMGCSEISSLLGNKSVSLHSLVNNQVYGSPSDSSASEIPVKVIDRLKEKGGAIIAGGDIYLSLKKKDRLLGVIVVQDADGDNSKTLTRAINLISGLTLFLSQQNAIVNASKMMGSIDQLFEELDA